MTPIQSCILKKTKGISPVWIMRQAGRYLPEFRKIRKTNKDFIKLCFNKKLVSEITLQPIRRFNFDAAIIFSDILIIPHALGQTVSFTKDLGPQLDVLDIPRIKKVKYDDFTKFLEPIYSALKKISNNKILRKKDIIGFVGSPWTILVYMINCSSPKKKLIPHFYKDEILFKEIFQIISDFTKIHIFNQVKSGATLIQLFDSWAGLVKKNKLQEYIYEQNRNIVDYIKSLKVPAICFPRGIKDYGSFVNHVKPDVISIDYNVKPEKILSKIDIPIQGGIDPKILLTNKDNVKKEVNKYKEIFKDHPYIFNLGHGILPDTDPKMVEYFVKIIKDK